MAPRWCRPALAVLGFQRPERCLGGLITGPPEVGSLVQRDYMTPGHRAEGPLSYSHPLPPAQAVRNA